MFWVRCPCRDHDCTIRVWHDDVGMRTIHQHGDNPEALLFINDGTPVADNVNPDGSQRDPYDRTNAFADWSHRVHQWLDVDAC